MKDFLELNVLDFKYLQINILEIIAIIAISFVGIILTRTVNKVYRVSFYRKIDKNLFIKTKYIFLLTLISIVLLMVVPSFTDIEILKFKRLLVKPFNIILIAFIILITLLVTRLIKIYYRRNQIKNKRIERRSLFPILSVIWIISLTFIFKTVIIDSQEIADYILFKVKEIPITVFDIFFLFLISFITSILLIGLNIFFQQQVKSGKIEHGTSAALLQISKYLLWILAITVVLETAGFRLSILLAGSAALLVGFGLGIKQIFGDVASGLVILVERTLIVGDIIEVDKIVAKVVHIGLRTTTIETRDSTQIIVPNSKFTNENVLNWSHMDITNRFNVSVGVAYSSDIKLVMDILKSCAVNHESVLKIPEPLVIFDDFNDYSLDFKLHFWTTNAFAVEKIKSDIRIMINQSFIENKIVIPFPIRTIQINQ